MNSNKKALFPGQLAGNNLALLDTASRDSASLDNAMPQDFCDGFFEFDFDLSQNSFDTEFNWADGSSSNVVPSKSDGLGATFTMGTFPILSDEMVANYNMTASSNSIINDFGANSVFTTMGAVESVVACEPAPASALAASCAADWAMVPDSISGAVPMNMNLSGRGYASDGMESLASNAYIPQLQAHPKAPLNGVEQITPRRTTGPLSPQSLQPQASQGFQQSLTQGVENLASSIHQYALPQRHILNLETPRQNATLQAAYPRAYILPQVAQRYSFEQFNQQNDIQTNLPAVAPAQTQSQEQSQAAVHRELVRPNWPVLRDTQRWKSTHNHLKTIWNLENVYSDSIASSASYLDGLEMNIAEPRHDLPVQHEEIPKGQTTQRAIAEAMKLAFARGAGWCVRSLVTHINSELRNQGTMLGFQPKKRIRKKEEVEKSLIQNFLSNYPPSLPASSCSDMIGWAFDEFYPGVFTLYGARGELRSHEEIQRARDALRQEQAPKRQVPTKLEVRPLHSPIVQQQQDPIQQPQTSDAASAMKSPKATGEQGTPEVRFARFSFGPPMATLNYENGVYSISNDYNTLDLQNRKKGQTSPQALGQTAVDAAKPKLTYPRDGSNGAKGPRRSRRRKKEDWCLSGEKRWVEYESIHGWSYKCTDGQWRLLDDGEEYDRAMQRTEMAAVAVAQSKANDTVGGDALSKADNTARGDALNAKALNADGEPAGEDVAAARAQGCASDTEKHTPGHTQIITTPKRKRVLDAEPTAASRKRWRIKSKEDSKD